MALAVQVRSKGGERACGGRRGLDEPVPWPTIAARHEFGGQLVDEREQLSGVALHRRSRRRRINRARVRRHCTVTLLEQSTLQTQSSANDVHAAGDIESSAKRSRDLASTRGVQPSPRARTVGPANDYTRIDGADALKSVEITAQQVGHAIAEARGEVTTAVHSERQDGQTV